jgi:hypothetical protein
MQPAAPAVLKGGENMKTSQSGLIGLGSVEAPRFTNPVSSTAVPEPPILALFGLGLLGISLGATHKSNRTLRRSSI